MKPMYNFYILFTYYFLIIYTSYSQTTASFVCPDTVCVNQSFTIQNTSTGGSSYYWNFCSGSTNTTPQAINLGNIGNYFDGPVYTTIAKDGPDYYVFVTNNWGGTITRLFFGNSLLNTPVATNLGNLGGAIPVSIEDMQIENENGIWIGIAVGGTGGNSRIIRLNFGNSLMNTPVATNMGNIGNMNYPHSLNIYFLNGIWYGLTVNKNSNTITQFNFGNSLGNIPTGNNIGNIGLLDNPDGFALIYENNTWWGLITNVGNNSLTRLNFGSNLNNIPTGVNLGINSLFNSPRGISLFKDCNSISGLITNETSNNLIAITFPNGIMNQMNVISYGTLSNFSFPHDITQFRVGDTLYAFIPNVTNHTLSRVFFPSCTNSSIPSSTLYTPPPISYSVPGTYNISLVVNEGLPTQSNFCKQIVVLNSPIATINGDTNYCQGDTIKLFGLSSPGSTFYWSGPNGFTSTNQNIIIPNANNVHSGSYSLTVSNGICTSNPMNVNVNISGYFSINLGNDTTVCPNTPFILDAGHPGSSYLWNTNATTQTINVTQSGSYSVTVTTSTGCVAKDTINIQFQNFQFLDLGPDTLICTGESIVLLPGNGYSSYVWSDGSTLPTLIVTAPGIYSVTVKEGACESTDQIQISECNSEIWVPNVFTPNGDGINDLFYPVYTNIDNLTLYIFNRWGNQLYEGSGKNAKWDGTYKSLLCPEGVYYYLILYDKKGINTGSMERHGCVTLLR